MRAWEDVQTFQWDMKHLEARHDVVTYTSSPMEHDLTIGGDLLAVRYASTDVKDTDWWVHVSDVDERGRSNRLTLGALRARFRGLEDPRYRGRGSNFEREALLSGNSADGVKYEIGVKGVANTFKNGHRIRIAIMNAMDNYTFSNSDTVGDGGLVTETMVGNIAVHHSARYPSHVVLPVLAPPAMRNQGIREDGTGGRRRRPRGSPRFRGGDGDGRNARRLQRREPSRDSKCARGCIVRGLSRSRIIKSCVCDQFHAAIERGRPIAHRFPAARAIVMTIAHERSPAVCCLTICVCCTQLLGIAGFTPLLQHEQGLTPREVTESQVLTSLVLAGLAELQNRKPLPTIIDAEPVSWVLSFSKLKKDACAKTRPAPVRNTCGDLSAASKASNSLFQPSSVASRSRGRKPSSMYVIVQPAASGAISMLMRSTSGASVAWRR